MDEILSATDEISTKPTPYTHTDILSRSGFSIQFGTQTSEQISNILYTTRIINIIIIYNCL